MKIRIDVTCTPEEARAFLGLPDVAPLQAAVMEELRKRTMTGLEAVDPETILKTWFPIGVQGLEQAQRMFWSQIAQAAGTSDDKAKDET